MFHYKLSYFDIRGRAETARMILHYADQDFEDHRIQQADWPEFKKRTPFGKVPVLEVNGKKKLTQSIAIYRYLAKKFGLAGRDPWESAQLDSIAYLHQDFIKELGNFPYVMTGFVNGDKNKVYNELFIPAAEKYFPVLEKILKKSGSGFFGKNGPTWVDFYISEEITTLSGFAPDFFKNYRDLIAFKERVHNLPELKNYIKSRKQTPM